MHAESLQSCPAATPWAVALQATFHSSPLGKNTSMGCYGLLQGIFPTQGSNPGLFCLLHWQVGSLPLQLHGKIPWSMIFPVGDRMHISYVSCIGRRFFTTQATWEAPKDLWFLECLYFRFGWDSLGFRASAWTPVCSSKFILEVELQEPEAIWGKLLWGENQSPAMFA